VLSLGAVLAAVAVAAGEPERDDPGARLQATREWYGVEAAPRARILEAARREKDRYAIGSGRAASGAQVFVAGRVSNSSFVSVGPTHAEFAMNGGRYTEIDSGRVRQIVPHPVDPDVLYLSTAGGGVWKTYNARSATILWEPITDALGTTAVGALAMDPANPDILFLGFGDPFDVQQPGITRSTDGGGTWSAPIPLRATYGATSLTAGTVTDVKVDPRNSAVALATTDVGLFRTNDGGANWTHVALTSTASSFFYLWSLAYAGNDVWLATGETADITLPTTPAGAGSLGLWRSTDDGASWQYATTALPNGESTAQIFGRATLATAESTLADPASARIYMLAASKDGKAQADLLRSDDAGLSFQSLQVNGTRQPENPNPNQQSLDVGGAQAWYNQALLVDPAQPDTVFIGGQLSMVRSTDAGRHWWVVSNWLPLSSQNGNINRPYVHADLHAFAVGADRFGLNRTFYAGSDGGLGVSTDALTVEAGMVTFSTKSNEGLVSHLVYTVACAPESWPPGAQGFVAGGMQDNGTRVRAGDSTTFNQLLGGDGIGLAVSAGISPGTLVPDLFFASVARGLYLSMDGGQTFGSFMEGLAQLPFFVRIGRDAADRFLTFSGSPAAFYRWQKGEPAWTNVSGTLHWQEPVGKTTGFTTLDQKAIGLRNLAGHPRPPPGNAGTWAAVSNRYTYMTANGGTDWLVGVQPKPPGSAAGAFQLTSIEFDPRDDTGRSYYITTLGSALIDAADNLHPYPPGFARVFRTINGGGSWEGLGAQGAAAGGLPDVGVNVIKVDPGDPSTLYVGTEVGLYRSTDAGGIWSRFGAGTLPLVDVRDVCIAPASQRLTAATYGRGFWQIDTGAASAAGVRGLGDTNFDSRIDGEDLIDLADGFDSAQSSPVYRWQADMVGATNKIDVDDLTALLAKFGGRP